MNDENYEYDFKRWNRKEEQWEATDGKPWDSEHPRLVGIIVDGYQFYLLHGHRYVKGRRYPDWIGVHIIPEKIQGLGIEQGDRVIMQIFPYRRDVYFGCNFINKITSLGQNYER